MEGSHIFPEARLVVYVRNVEIHEYEIILVFRLWYMADILKALPQDMSTDVM